MVKWFFWSERKQVFSLCRGSLNLVITAVNFTSFRHKSCRHNQCRIPETVRLISDYWQTIATPPSTARVVSCTCHRSRWPGLCLHRAGSAYIGACFIFHCSTKAFQLGKKTAAFSPPFFLLSSFFLFFFLSFFISSICLITVWPHKLANLLWALLGSPCADLSQAGAGA